MSCKLNEKSVSAYPTPCPSPSSTHVPSPPLCARAHRLLQLLASLRQHSTGPAAFPTRADPSTASPLAPIPALPALHRGDVIEIQGPAASGKTHLLYHILLSFLVPDAQIAAVVYDTDAAFDVQRFRHLLLSRTSRLSTLDPQDSVRRALARLHVFRPSSLAQLAASIANLPAYHASHMPDQEIALLAIDSVSTFYWADRFAAEQLRNIAPAMDKSVPMALPLHHVLDAVQTMRRSHRPLAVLTNWALISAPSRSESLYKQHLRPFPVLEDGIADLGAKRLSDADHSSPFRLAHHITLSSPSSDPFPAAPLDDALLPEARHSKGAVDNGRVHCLTRSSGARDTVRFSFQITDDDILVHPTEPIL
jgi:DNA-repair protein XRCC2